MEVWTFINKETNEIIRYDLKPGDIEFGALYYFTTVIYSPLWFVDSENVALLAYKKEVHPYDSMNYNTPSTNSINIEDYKIIKFEINNI